jgi:hypothetical protein
MPTLDVAKMPGLRLADRKLLDVRITRRSRPNERDPTSLSVYARSAIATKKSSDFPEAAPVRRNGVEK